MPTPQNRVAREKMMLEYFSPMLSVMVKK